MTTRRDPPAGPPIFYVCGDTAGNPARSGIQTVVRSLAAAFGGQTRRVRPVIWDFGWKHLRPLPPDWSLGLGAETLRDPPSVWGHRVPIHLHPRHRRAPVGSWVLLPELMYHEGQARQLAEYVHRHGWRLAAILHDLIPVHHPEFVPPGLPAIHAAYARGLSRADVILPTTATGAREWNTFVAHEELPSPPVRVCALASDLPGIPRVRSLQPDVRGRGARMLCVSTLETRKNHRSLFAAYEIAAACRPDLALELDLVGASHVDAAAIADAARVLAARYPGRVRWHERVEHATLRRLYAEADFTVYPSVVEGFGLPVIESLWSGRPCVCANFGVMAENAAGGGCLTVDVREPRALADAILALAGSAELRQQLATEATTRPLKTWSEYASDVLAALGSIH